MGTAHDVITTKLLVTAAELVRHWGKNGISKGIHWMLVAEHFRVRKASFDCAHLVGGIITLGQFDPCERHGCQSTDTFS